MIRQPVILVGGFLQEQGTYNGIIRLWDELSIQTASDPFTRVFWYPWNADAADIAEMIFRFRPMTKIHDVILIGYSWGGTLVIRIARELRKRGIKVKLMILCDAIYRVRVLKFLAFVSCVRLGIPKNVEEVQSFRQENSYLRGHKLTFHGATQFNEFLAPNTEHKYMDDLIEFRKYVLKNVNPK